MRNQALWCLVALLWAAVAALGRPSEDAPGEFSLVERRADGDGVVLVPVNAEDRLDYKIEHDDGSYQYGYQSGQLGPEGGYSFRHEYRRQDGVLLGQHGYQLPGEPDQTVNYVADSRGYRVLADGQQYQPVSEEQLGRQRHLLGDLLREGEEEEEVPLELDLSLLERIESPEEVQISADPEVALAATPLRHYSELDPDSGAFRFGYRSVADDGSVSFRQERRRPNGVVIGQFGQRAAGQPGRLVTYVSDAFGYREVEPVAGVVRVVSRDQALRQLPEARSQLAEVKMASEEESASEMESEIESGMESVVGMSQQEDEAKESESAVAESEPDVVVVSADGAADVGSMSSDVSVDAGSISADVATSAGASEDSVVVEALPESVAEPADALRWASPPVYAAALPYHAAPYPYHAAQPYFGGATGYQFQTVHQPIQYGYQQYQWLPYSAWYPYFAPVATPYRYQYQQQQPASYVRAKYQYPAPEYPLYEPHLYSPIVSDEEESR